MDIRENFTKIKKRYKEVETLLAAPEIMQNLKEYASLNKEYKCLGNIMEQINRYEEMKQPARTMLFSYKKRVTQSLLPWGVRSVTIWKKRVR
jgi:protein subunit release factor A